jgi:aminotransferase
MGLPYTRAGGTFYILIDIRQTGMNADDFCKKLLEAEKLALLPSSFFGIEGFVRLSTASPLAQLKMGMGRLERFMQHLA